MNNSLSFEISVYLFYELPSNKYRTLNLQNEISAGGAVRVNTVSMNLSNMGII